VRHTPGTILLVLREGGAKRIAWRPNFDTQGDRLGGIWILNVRSGNDIGNEHSRVTQLYPHFRKGVDTLLAKNRDQEKLDKPMKRGWRRFWAKNTVDILANRFAGTTEIFFEWDKRSVTH